VHPLIFEACNTENGINVETYQALGTRITLDGLMDILEMKAVRDSWNHAELLNNDETRERDRQMAEARAQYGGRR
jgi:hypothetical protein